MEIDNFLETQMCKERTACRSCRFSEEWRKIFNAPEICPYGIKKEDLSFAKKEAPAEGPGTELKKLLSMLGFDSKPNCKCNARANMMNTKEAEEPGWCENHLEEIVGWLKEEAQNRKLPFIESIARFMIKRAIRNAKNKQSKN